MLHHTTSHHKVTNLGRCQIQILNGFKLLHGINLFDVDLHFLHSSKLGSLQFIVGFVINVSVRCMP